MLTNKTVHTNRYICTNPVCCSNTKKTQKTPTVSLFWLFFNLRPKQLSEVDGWTQPGYKVKGHTPPKIVLDSKPFKIPPFPYWLMGKLKRFGIGKKKDAFTLSFTAVTHLIPTCPQGCSLCIFKFKHIFYALKLTFIQYFSTSPCDSEWAQPLFSLNIYSDRKHPGSQ